MSSQNNKPQPIKEKVRDTDKQITTHSNLVAVSLNAEEACIHFGLRTESNPHLADGVSKIYLSTPSFKRLIATSAELIKTVEAALGEEIEPDPNRKLTTPEARQRMDEYSAQRKARIESRKANASDKV